MRGKRSKKRQLLPDPILKSKVVSRLVNILMQDGRKATAEGIIYTAIDKLHEDKKEALKIFEQAIKNVMPQQEVRSRRIGGATYQVPQPLKHDRAEALAVRWIVGAARKKKGKPMDQKLFEELNLANQNTGDAIKKRDDTHKMAEANRAFSHFAKF
jgi:small subunit ribosomal protein S7